MPQAPQWGLLKTGLPTGEDAEKLLETVLSMPHHAFYIFDYRKQQMLLGEPELASLYGYPVAEVHALPEGWASVIHPDDRAPRRRAPQSFFCMKVAVPKLGSSW